MVVVGLCLLLFQPDSANLRRLFEQEYQRLHTAQSARDLGLFLARHGEPAEAREALAEALRLSNDLHDAFELALVSPAAEAEPLLKRAAAAKDTALAARSFEALGHFHDATGDKASAVDAYRHALALRESANVLEALAAELPPHEAVPMLERALVINRREHGARHPQTATTEANLAGALLNSGRADDSIRAARDAMAIFEERLGADHPRTATAATILAFGFRAKGYRASAEEYFRRALAIDRVAYGEAHPQTINDARTLAEFLAERP